MTYQSNNSEKGFAVFSEIYYPKGWEATIDEKQVAIKCVNYVLRGIEIPEGKHIIHFGFRPQSYLIGNKITSWASYLVFFVFLTGMGRETVLYLSKRKDENLW